MTPLRWMVLVGFLALEFAACQSSGGGGGGDETSAAAPVMDLNLVGTWAYSNSTQGIAIQLYSPNGFRAYEVDTSVSCELYATGTVRTASGYYYTTRVTGQVTSTSCQVYFGVPSPDTNKGKENPTGTQYLVNPGVSLTVQVPGETLLLVPYNFNWGAVPQHSTITYSDSPTAGTFDSLFEPPMGDADGPLSGTPLGW